MSPNDFLLKNKQIVYVSGPITGTTDYEPRFRATQECLEDQGYIVLNPVCLHMGCPHTWLQYVEEDIRYLRNSHAMYVMPGWQQSRGCRWEFREAVIRGIPILNMRPLVVWFWSVVLALTRGRDAKYIAEQRKQKFTGTEGGSDAAISRR